MERVRIPIAAGTLDADLDLPADARALVLFVHGSGSNRRSPRNRAVAAALHEDRFATLLLDLLTPEEAERDEQDRALRFDIELLAARVVAATDWLAGHAPTQELRLAYCGASTGAAAALIAAARRPTRVVAVISRGGRPDLAGNALEQVRAPVRMIVGGDDGRTLELNRMAAARLRDCRIDLVPAAGHLFEEPGTLDAAITLTRQRLRELLP